MDLPSLRTLALADVGTDELGWMARHGEDPLIERKAALPKPPGLGADVASFSNTVGGWLLLGIGDDGQIVGWDPGRVDRQAHLGDLLRNQVDPVPPLSPASASSTASRSPWSASLSPRISRSWFEAQARCTSATRVARSLWTTTERLWPLTQRGTRAESDALHRLRELEIVYETLLPPDLPTGRIAAGPTDKLQAIVRAAPITRDSAVHRVADRRAQWGGSNISPWSSSGWS